MEEVFPNARYRIVKASERNRASAFLRISLPLVSSICRYLPSSLPDRSLIRSRKSTRFRALRGLSLFTLIVKIAISLGCCKSKYPLDRQRGRADLRTGQEIQESGETFPL